MPRRPDYQVYEDAMLKCCKGFPQWDADPYGSYSNGDRDINGIRIGDVGYFDEGKFVRLLALDIASICQGYDGLQTRRLAFNGPVYSDSVQKVSVEAGVDASALAISLGGAAVRFRCDRGDGALLNLQQGSATFRKCDKRMKDYLGEHFLSNYRQWLKDDRFRGVSTSHDIFLVTGTIMTKNWEAATFSTENMAIGSNISVNATEFVGGHVSIDWRTCNQTNPGFNVGHCHPNQAPPSSASNSSFTACCQSCDEPPENQCIFLRGWRIRERFRLGKSVLAQQLPVANTDSSEGQFWLVVKNKLVRIGFNVLARSKSDGSSHETAITEKSPLNELEGTPSSDNDAISLYDQLALGAFKEDRTLTQVMVHDDDVIDFLGGDPELATETLPADFNSLSDTAAAHKSCVKRPAGPAHESGENPPLVHQNPPSPTNRQPLPSYIPTFTAISRAKQTISNIISTSLTFARKDAILGKQVKEEVLARRLSESIDRHIEAEETKRKARQHRETKVLLLGPSGAGKSTVLKQFQLMHNTTQFDAERLAWRLIVHLNLVASVRRILETVIGNARGQDSVVDSVYQHQNDLCILGIRLFPLLEAEDQLTRLLTGKADQGLILNASSIWKDVLLKPSENGGQCLLRHADSLRSKMNELASDILALWHHPTVQAGLGVNLRLSGFFLDDVARVTALDYIPTNDDILRTRVKTVGIGEHRLTLNFDGDPRSLIIYDIGGDQSHRQYWAPYFSEVDAIIFLAAISEFDEFLTEDSSMNRLLDALALWKNLVGNSLLAKARIVLMLNKCDLLEYKLSSGRQFANYIPSFHGQSNDCKTVCKYVKDQFVDTSEAHSLVPTRKPYVHYSSMTNAMETPVILRDVQENVLSRSLNETVCVM